MSDSSCYAIPAAVAGLAVVVLFGAGCMYHGWMLLHVSKQQQQQQQTAGLDFGVTWHAHVQNSAYNSCSLVHVIPGDVFDSDHDSMKCTRMRLHRLALIQQCTELGRTLYIAAKFSGTSGSVKHFVVLVGAQHAAVHAV
jgi:hypothetical protein